MTIVINSLTVSNSLSFTTKSTNILSSGLTPSSVSPVLKTVMNITLDPLFPYTLNASDFSVNATSKTNTTYVRYLNVLNVTDTAASTGVAAVKMLTVMFGGAYTGNFTMSIRHSTYGLLDTTGMDLTVESKVTAVSPSSGSIYGGTLLTITGTNFGTVPTDNPVQISTSGGIGSINCYV
jgi:hypothetical protein